MNGAFVLNADSGAVDWLLLPEGDLAMLDDTCSRFWTTGLCDMRYCEDVCDPWTCGA
jgi:hypothetical protein